MRKLFLSAALILAILALPRLDAWARMHVRTTGRAAMGFTSNVDGTEQNVQADGFNELEPGVSLYFAGARAAHQLQYSLALTLFYIRLQSNLSATNRLDWISLFHLGESVRLRLTANGALGRQNLTSLGRSPGSSGGAGGLSSGAEWFAGGSVTQGLDWEVAPDVVLGQELGADLFAPFTDTQPQTLDLRGGLSGTRSWERFSMGLRLIQNLAFSTAYTPPDIEATPPPPPSVRQDELEVMLTQLVAVYNRQLTRAWQFEVYGGAVRAAQLSSASNQLFSPVAYLALRFAERGYDAELTLEHTVRQSLFIGEALMSQDARLRARMPIGRRPTRWSLEGTLGYEHGQVLDLDGLDRDSAGNEIEVPKFSGNHLHVGLFDVGGRWRMNDSVEWSLRYQYSRQWIVGVIEAAEQFDRHLVLLDARFGYPPERVRTRLPRERHRMSETDWQRFFNPEAPEELRPAREQR